MDDIIPLIFIGVFFTFTALILIFIYQQNIISGAWDEITVLFIKCISFLIVITIGFYALFRRN